MLIGYLGVPSKETVGPCLFLPLPFPAMRGMALYSMCSLPWCTVLPQAQSNRTNWSQAYCNYVQSQHYWQKEHLLLDIFCKHMWELVGQHSILQDTFSPSNTISEFLGSHCIILSHQLPLDGRGSMDPAGTNCFIPWLIPHLWKAITLADPNCIQNSSTMEV